MIMNIRRLYYLRACGLMIAALAVAAGLNACSDADSALEPGAGENPGSFDNTVTFSFRISDGNVSRAGHDDHVTSPDENPDINESSINTEDVAFYVFADDHLVYRPLQDDDFYSLTGASGGGYTVNLKIDYKQLAVDPDSPDRIAMRILAVANMNTSGTDPYAYPQLDYGSTYAQVIGELESKQFSLPATWDPANLPSATGRGLYIPMFGTAVFQVNPKELYDTETWQTIYLGSVSMLRAVVKVELLDGIADRDDEGFPKIADAWLDYSVVNGKLLPADALTYINGNQVDKNNLGDAGETPAVRNMRSFTGTLTHTVNGASLRETLKIFRSYCPEQSISSATPCIRLKVQPSASTPEAEWLDYTIPLEGYDGKPFGFVNLYRNHIYRIRVNSVNIGVPAEITVSALPWTQEDIEWNYDQNPGLADGGEIKWVENTYQSIDQNTARLVMMRDMTPAKCSFTLSSPLGATWRAILVPETADRDAFKFIDSAGNQVDDVSGTIDGNAIDLTITATDSAPKETNRTRLQIIVTTLDGRTMTADVCAGKYGDSKYFTIIQNSQL